MEIDKYDTFKVRIFTPLFEAQCNLDLLSDLDNLPSDGSHCQSLGCPLTWQAVFCCFPPVFCFAQFLL